MRVCKKLSRITIGVHSLAYLVSVKKAYTLFMICCCIWIHFHLLLYFAVIVFLFLVSNMKWIAKSDFFTISFTTLCFQLDSDEFEKISSSEERQSFFQKLEEVW